MGEVVNLRMARKRIRRRDDEIRADENRRRHGRTAAEKKLGEREEKALRSHLDAHHLGPRDEE